MTKTDLLELITNNLATGSNITALKHRDVENAIVDYFSSAIGNPIVAYGKIGPIDIKSSTQTTYSSSGNIVSATKITSPAATNVIRVVIPDNLLSSQEFKVRIDIESAGTSVDYDNNLDPILFRKVGSLTNTFDLILEETVGVTDSIYLHIEVIQLWW